MRMSTREFRAWPNKAITLLGMSGAGKTRLATRLRQSQWFHYSADYRIGTRYLSEPILDNIKTQAMQVPFLRDLFRSDSIYISNNITVDNLHPVRSFLGMLGDPARGGLSLEEFGRRQALYRDAEVASMKDVPEFIRKAREIYGYRHLVNDSAGSLCDLDDPEVLSVLADHTVILYIKVTEHGEAVLLRRAEEDPKPLYYREAFLKERIDAYLRERSLGGVVGIDPDDFVRWIFPHLFRARIPRYEDIARRHGYILPSDELAGVRGEEDFLRAVEKALDRDRG